MSLRRLGPHQWRIVWELGTDPVTGQRRQKTERFTGTKEKAMARYVSRQQEFQTGIGLGADGLTVRTLAAEWLALKVGQGRKASTIQRYRDMIDDYINPVLGSLLVDDLTPLHVQQAIRHWQTQPRKDRRSHRETVAPRTVKYAYVTLSAMLGQAMRWQMIGRNVAALVEPPRVDKAESTWWTADEAARFLRTVDGHPYNVVFALALLTGLRQGELLALQWSDVDWAAGTITVRRSQDAHRVGVFDTPKTAAARRRVQCDATALDLLKAHQTAQKRQRLAIGPAWHETGLICASGVGTPLSPSNVRRVMLQCMARAGVPRIKFHDLRHTHASLFLQHEPNIRILADRLGHTSVSFTIQTYVHAKPEAQAKPAAAVGAALFRKETS